MTMMEQFDREEYLKALGEKAKRILEHLGCKKLKTINHSMTGWFTENPSELDEAITLQWNTWRHQKQFMVSGEYPWQPAPSRNMEIFFSHTKSIPLCVKDIERRFLPDYRARFEKMKNLRTLHNNREETKKRIYDELGAIVGLPAVVTDDTGEEISMENRLRYLSIASDDPENDSRGYDGHVSVRIDHLKRVGLSMTLDEGQAKKVMEVIATFRAHGDTDGDHLDAVENPANYPL